MSEPLLELTGIRAGFNAQTVIHGVDLAVPRGSVTGLFGLNGAGKSVLLKVVAGLVPAWAGQIVFAGHDITRSGPEQRVALGMGHVPQGRQVFGSLTVEQNLRIGGYPMRGRKAELAGRVAAAYETFPLLAAKRDAAAGTLSGGQQASLAVARALVANPQLVLIDEPSAGLAPAIVEELLEALLLVQETGVTMLLVEQNIRFGLRLADTACLLQRGRIVYRGGVADLDETTLATHLGVGRLLRGDLSSGLSRRKPARRPAVRPG
ncbi:MAG TPA: ABC transporter ATP-binding protein [Mycobacteriales bacterium]|nr:ABC transporter ATP-binding protein [Mycobacteriales bacterium]